MNLSKIQFRRHLTQAIAGLRYRRVLDCASGSAKMRGFFADDAWYFAVDRDPQKFQGLARDGGEYQVGDIASRPFVLRDQKPFDLIVSTHTFHHLNA